MGRARAARSRRPEITCRRSQPLRRRCLTTRCYREPGHFTVVMVVNLVLHVTKVHVNVAKMQSMSRNSNVTWRRSPRVRVRGHARLQARRRRGAACTRAQLEEGLGGPGLDAWSIRRARRAAPRRAAPRCATCCCGMSEQHQADAAPGGRADADESDLPRSEAETSMSVAKGSGVYGGAAAAVNPLGAQPSETDAASARSGTRGQQPQGWLSVRVPRMPKLRGAWRAPRRRSASCAATGGTRTTPLGCSRW